jgi:GH24 family phage-related lysozyme (muramidase)
MAFERLGGLFGNLYDKMSTFGAPNTDNPEFSPEVQQEAPSMSPDMMRTKQFEGGHQSKAYLDSLGYPTIGTGKVLEHQKYDTMPNQYSSMNMSEEEGDSLYNEDYAKKQSEVQSLYGENWNTLPSEAQGVLTDMAYNVGSQGLFNKFPG